MEWTTIRVSVDVRDWINELVSILSENIQKPSLTQNDAIRWMCKQTISAAAEVYRENYARIERTHNVIANPLNIKELMDSYAGMKEALAKMGERKS